jgi:hypothetical protein
VFLGGKNLFAFFARIPLVIDYAGFSDRLKTGALRVAQEIPPTD